MNVLARAVALGAAVLLVGVPAGAPALAAPQPINAEDCKRAPGLTTPKSTWALNQLQLARTNPITQGRRVDNGEPVPVAVIDSGLDRTHPQFRGVDAARPQDAIADDPGASIDDCIGHGTQVTAIIAAQPDPSRPDFVGVAPRARIIPIKVTNGDKVAADDVARGIDLAVAAGARIANVSLVLPVDVASVRAAVARAQRAGMLIVAAAGNDGTSANQLVQYPAAYADRFDNVLGVGATVSDNTIADFSGSGRYVGVVAPGSDVQTVAVLGGYLVVKGTSFAAPYVSGVAALTLAAHPGMSAKTLRDRLEATADPPPATVPDTKWGYGTVNPYLAVTSLRVDAPAAAPTPPRPKPLAAAPASAEPDRTLQHVSIAVALGLLGLTVVVMVVAVVMRGHRRAIAPAPASPRRRLPAGRP